MFWAILYKDLRLLRIYLRMSLLTSILIYPVFFGFIYWFSENHLGIDEAKQFVFQLRLTLLSSGGTGLALTFLFASIIAASSIALERSDRSAEFLACLPPTRWQNLLSKLILVISAVGGMLALHNIATFGAWSMTAYAHTPLKVDLMASLLMSCVTVCMTGFSFAGSSLMKSNGGPALLGFFSPLLSISIVLGIGKLLDIPSEGNAFAIRYSITCFALGITMFLCGSLWYLNRSEP